MGPIWGGQVPGGPHVGPMNFALWDGFALLAPNNYVKQLETADDDLLGYPHLHPPNGLQIFERPCDLEIWPIDLEMVWNTFLGCFIGVRS